MSVTLSSSPPALAFSGDKIFAGFTCENLFEAPPVKSINKLTLPGSPEIGSTFTIKWGNNTVIMKAALVPDDSGYQFLASTFGLIFTPAAQLPYFKDNYLLSKDFILSENGSEIILEAKNPGAAYNLSIGNLTQGSTAAVKPNYGIQFRLYCENAAGTGFEMIDESPLSVLVKSSSGYAEAPIGDKIHTYVSQEIRKNYPDKPEADPLECKKSCRRYYFEFAESSGDPIIVRKVQTSPVYTILHGALSHKARLTKSLPALISPGELIEDRFLSQAPLIVSTRSNQQQFLYFFNTRTTRSVRVKCKFYFRDNSNYNLNLATVELKTLHKYGFNVTFDKLFDSVLHAGKIVYKYEIYLEAEDNSRVSEIRTFWMDYSPKRYIRYFLNYSSWGTMDSRMFYGKGTTEFEITQFEAEKAYSNTSDPMAGTSLVYNISLKSKYSLSTGFLSRSQLFWNRDFFLSELKYRVIKNLILPIKVTSKTIQELPDGTSLFAQNFDYEPLYDETAYTSGDIEEPGIVIEGITKTFRKEVVKIFRDGMLIESVEAPGEYHIVNTGNSECIPTFAYVQPNSNNELYL